MTRRQTRAIEAAVAAAEAALEARHPAASRPAWFERSVAQSVRVPADDTVEVRYRAERKVPLKPDQAWEDSPDGRRLIETDANTGMRYVVITRDTGEFLDLFTVVFDIPTGAIDIVVDADLDAIDPEGIEPPG